MSVREALVVPVTLEKHDNADSLSIVRIGGFSVVVRTEQWTGLSKGIYIPPDEIVDTSREEFSFLDKPRIKAKKIRGIWSMGLLIPAPSHAQIGDNYYDMLGLQHYEPELHLNMGDESVKAPSTFSGLPKYDIENARGKYSNMFVDGEDVFCMVKIHGANTSVTYVDEQLYVHSRTQWPKEGDSIFWKAVNSCPELIYAAKENPGLLIYGETYGMNPGFNYDASKTNPKFRCFDIMRPDRTFFNVSELTNFVQEYKIPTAPILGTFKFNLDELCKLAESGPWFNKGIDEGIVFRSLEERYNTMFGRVIGKIINPAYLEKN